MTIAAKPTMYGGVKFRSRLEARWACFFDQLGLKWEYEPMDCDGWTPDFLVHSDKGKRPALIEVKPLARLSPDEPLPEEARKILGAPEEFEAMLVGLSPFVVEGGGYGLIWDRKHEKLVCDVLDYDDGQPVERADLERRWAVACNSTQWTPRPVQSVGLPASPSVSPEAAETQAGLRAAEEAFAREPTEATWADLQRLRQDSIRSARTSGAAA